MTLRVQIPKLLFKSHMILAIQLIMKIRRINLEESATKLTQRNMISTEVHKLLFLIQDRQLHQQFMGFQKDHTRDIHHIKKEL